MFDVTVHCHPTTGERYIATSLLGYQLLEQPFFNKGTAFSPEERAELKLAGLLPPAVATIDAQLNRAYEEFNNKNTPLEKHIYLNSLHDRNETLFFRLLQTHITEMLPLVYTPTVGEAIMKYSHIYRRPRGLYITYPEIDRIDDILDQRQFENIDLVCVTDGERILGLGDQGGGGIGITVGKLTLYTVCAGVDPTTTLAIGLDVGTNNQQLLDDSQYLGWRHQRISGAEYDEFIEKFVSAIMRKFPKVLLHWEDFGKEHATRILHKYQQRLCTFNDDIQGTGAVTSATLMAAMAMIGEKVSDQRVVFFGAGTAAVGVADQIMTAMMREGLPEAEARSRFYLIDSRGLQYQGREHISDFQQPFAQPKANLDNWQISDSSKITLEEVVKNVHPTILIGVSSQPGLFTREIVTQMASDVKRPIIFPLSNPTSRSEAKPEDLIQWTEGRAIVATGSPFPNVNYQGQSYTITQCNNSFIFPALGLAAIATKPKNITNEMIYVAAKALSECAPVHTAKNGSLLPALEEARAVCRKIALAVGKEAYKSGLAQSGSLEELEQRLDAHTWFPDYVRLRAV